MPNVVTDRGTFQTAAGGSITLSATSSTFTPAAGSILVVGITVDAKNDNTSSTYDAVFAVTDNIGDTGGGAWAQRATCTRGLIGLGAYTERVELWTRVIGTSPGAAKTVTASATINVLTTSTDGWLAGHLWEVSGQNASPIGLSASPSPATSVSTFAPNLGSVPAASSTVFGVIHDDNQAGPAVVQPSGWTESDEQAPAFGVISEWAFINGSSVQSPSWSGFTNSASVRILGVALEIIAAAGGGASITAPRLLVAPSMAATQAANW